MTIQEKIIGIHPKSGIFNEWIVCVDTPCSTTKRHRQLAEVKSERQCAIAHVAEWLIKHHLSDRNRSQLTRKKEILSKYDFIEFADSLRVFPTADKTKKGNLGETILTEYLSQTSGIEVLIYKLRYNPNVDQSMKGDDVLLIDSKQILVGESKFRATANKQAVETVSENMGTSLAMPISLGFIADRLYEQGQYDLSELVQEIQLNLGKRNFNIKNIGFILSSYNIGKHVESNLNSTNDKFVLISLGIDKPVSFIEDSFIKANELLLEVAE